MAICVEILLEGVLGVVALYIGIVHQKTSNNTTSIKIKDDGRLDVAKPNS